MPVDGLSRTVAAVTAFACFCAAAEEPVPIGTVIGAEPVMPGVECAADTDPVHPCAFLTSDTALCSMPLDTGCLLFDGDVLTLNGAALEYRICDGPVRRLAFTNGSIRYEVAGTCPDAVNETVSVLHDLELDPALPADRPED